MKKFIIGVDGGNTKTDYLLYDTEGNFIDGVRSGTCSHEVPSVGGFDGSYNAHAYNKLVEYMNGKFKEELF